MLPTLAILVLTAPLPCRFVADFAGPGLPPPLTVLRPDASAWRLADGALAITTQRGDVHERSNTYRNLFAVPAPPGNFTVTLRVRRFEPRAPVQHLSLGLFKSHDQLVRLTYWWRGHDRGLSLDREDAAVQRNVAAEALEFGDRPFWLRLSREGATLRAAWSAGSETWHDLGRTPWAATARWLGFYASNGEAEAPATVATIEEFEVMSDQPLPDRMPAEPARPKPTLHVYTDYGWLRGLNCIPSWGARIEEAWWRYDPAKLRQELALVRRIHGNTVRLWIEFTAWMADPDEMTRRFLDAVTAIDQAGMKAMPCLFNRWHDYRWDYGGTYTEDLVRDWAPKLEYVRALVTPLARDPRVLCWDLCNEPQAFDLNSEVNRREFAFLEAVAGAARAAGGQQPITIGTMTGGNIDLYAPLCDVLCGHPYAHTEADLAGAIAALKELGRKHGKPVLVNECVPGCLDDAKRAAAARWTTRLLAEAGFGWMGWSITEGRAIATRRDRIDGNGLDSQGFHAWHTADGRLRGGLEFLLEPPARRAPWSR